MLNDTHRADLVSWVEGAHAADTDFPIQNLPYGIFRRRDAGEEFRAGVAIGDQILDLAAVHLHALIGGDAAAAIGACTAPALNQFMSLGVRHWSALRGAISALLRTGTDAGQRAQERASDLLVAQSDAELTVPATIGDYTDFYASVQHATNVGSMFRPDNPLLPNYKWVPIGYHGRASSIVVSGAPVRRPLGQTKNEAAPAPSFGPSARLDYECEVGAWVGPGNVLGAPIPLGSVGDHLFGLSLLNDWSARDIQAWEYQPLGPFLAKNFATTVSPWVVTLEALAPYRVCAAERAAGDPDPLAYLASEDEKGHGGLDVVLEVWLRSAKMRAEGIAEQRLSVSNLAGLYWTVGQLLTHHASNGCNLRPGDLLGSGTVSGSTVDSRGCLLELTWRGEQPLTLPTGETRKFLEDGDEVIMRGFCTRAGFARIGFGECRGTVLPAFMR